jgi:hypothetical protein
MHMRKCPPVILQPGERELLEGVIHAPKSRYQYYPVQRARILLLLSEMAEEEMRGEKTLTILKIAGLCYTNRANVCRIRNFYFKDGLEKTLAVANPGSHAS